MKDSIPVPRGVQKDWRTYEMPLGIGGRAGRTHGVPEEWGDPVKYVVWDDRFGRRRLCVAHYSNGRSATLRIDANGVWKMKFGDVK